MANHTQLPTHDDCAGAAQIFNTYFSDEKEKLTSDLFKQLLRSPDSLIRQNVEISLANSLNNMVSAQASLERVTIKQQLTSEQQLKLVSAFPNFKLKFFPTQYEAHPFSHAHRILELRSLMDMCNYTSNSIYPTYDFYIKDIGGNWNTHAMLGNDHVHSCCPILDVADDYRQSMRLFYADTTSPHAYNYCNLKAQECTVSAPTAIFLHSIYDMSLTQIADSLHSANARVAFGTFIFDPQVILHDKGILRPLDICWKIMTKSTFLSTTKTIQFYFEKDGQLAYEHDYETYISFVRKPVIFSTNGTAYIVQFLQNVNGVQFFSIARTQSAVPISSVVHRIMTCSEAWISFRYYFWDIHTTTSSYAPTHMKKFVFTCPKELFERTFTYAMTLAEGKFTLSQVTSYCISQNIRVIVHGQQVATPEVVEGELVTHVSVCAYLKAYVSRWNSSKIVKAITDAEVTMRMRSDEAVWFSATMSPFRKIARWWCSQGAVSRTLADWSRLPHLYPVSMDDAVKELTFEQVVNYKSKETVSFRLTNSPGESNITPDSLSRIIATTLSSSPMPITGSLKFIDSTAFTVDRITLDLSKFLTIPNSSKGDCFYVASALLMNQDNPKSPSDDLTVIDVKHILQKSYFLKNVNAYIRDHLRNTIVYNTYPDHHMFMLLAVTCNRKVILEFTEHTGAYQITPKNPAYCDGLEPPLHFFCTPTHVEAMLEITTSHSPSHTSSTLSNFSPTPSPSHSTSSSSSSASSSSTQRTFTTVIDTFHGRRSPDFFFARPEPTAPEQPPTELLPIPIPPTVQWKTSHPCPYDNVGEFCCQLIRGPHRTAPLLRLHDDKQPLFEDTIAYFPAGNKNHRVIIEKIARQYPGRYWNVDDKFDIPLHPVGAITLFVNSMTRNDLCPHPPPPGTVHLPAAQATSRPAFLPGADTQTFYHNAMIEQLYIWRHSDHIIQTKIQTQAAMLPTPLVRSNLPRAHKDDWGLCIMKDQEQHWLHKPKEKKHGFIYDLSMRQIVPSPKHDEHPPDAYLVCKDLVVYNDHSLYSSAKNLFFQHGISIKLWSGVAGCGKTTTIVNNCDPTTQLILACTKTNAEDLFQRLTVLHGKVDKNNVKTLDSYMINNIKAYEEVWVDEALMQHAGAILFAAAASNCKILNLVGDGAQIPYICRLSDYTIAPYSNLMTVCTPDVKMEISYRCPQDVMAALVDSYKKFDLSPKTTSKVRRSMSLVKIRTLADVPFEPDTVYLTFKQTEKDELTRKFPNALLVKSVHEYQGSQSKNIIVVRLSTKPAEHIYMRPDHGLVALTRHTETLRYFTVNNSRDFFSNLVTSVITEQQLDSVFHDTNAPSDDYPLRVGYKDSPVKPLKTPSYQPPSPHIPFIYASTPDFKPSDQYLDFLAIKTFDPRPDSILKSSFSPYIYNDPIISFSHCRCDDPILVHRGMLQCTNCYTYLPVVNDRNFASLRKQLSSLKNSPIVRILGNGYGTSVYMSTVVQALKNSTVILHTGRSNADDRELINSFATTHNAANFTTMPITVFDYLRDDINLYQPTPLPRIIDPVPALQEWYDRVLPGFSTQLYEFDSYKAHTSDLNLPIQDISFPMSNLIPVKNFDTLTPNLRTALPLPRDQSLVETLLALMKRNMNCPELSSLSSDYLLADLVTERFVEAYVDPAKSTLFESFSDNPIKPNTYDLHRWLKTQQHHPNSEKLTPIHLEALNVYDFIIKKNPKPKMDPTTPFEYASLQTVIHHRKEINAYFSPMIKAAKERLKAVLLPNIKIYTDTSSTDFARTLDGIYPTSGSRLRFAEVDMSKYDKSQNLLHLLLDIAILLKLGFTPEDCYYWFVAHEFTIVYDKKNKVKYCVKFQRKSGDALTFLGNTIIIMCVCCIAFNIAVAIFCLFAGDDSLISFLVTEFNVSFLDVNSICASTFNFESKIYEYQYPSFCSKFLIATEKGWAFVPDPIKLTTKLGRSDLANPTHMKEYHISFCDLVKDFDDTAVVDKLSIAISERYKYTHSSNFAISALVSLTDYTLFQDLFNVDPTATYCYDVSSKLSDI